MHLRRLRVSTAGHREEQGVNQCLVLPRLGRAAQADVRAMQTNSILDAVAP